MNLLTLGLNHRTAPVAIREKAAFAAGQLPDAVRSLVANGDVSEATILSTCNRTEIYCRQNRIEPGPVFDWLCDYGQLPANELGDSTYTLPGEQAVQHAFRVAAGLDSMVLGEPQILGQMKSAFSVAHKAGATGKILNRLFQHTFSVAKQVRTDTTIGASAVSVAFAAVDLAKRIFSRLSDQTVLLIGAGETIELVARHLRQNEVRHIIVANRSIERAQMLAGQVQSEAVSLAEIPNRLHEADIVVASTASTLPILGKGTVESALRKRRHRPMFMIDLAVPRDIEHEVDELRDVFLYTVDDLHNVVQQNIASRREAAEEAEKIIDLQVMRFMHWLRSLDSVPTICAFRQQVEAIGEVELAQAHGRIARGEDPALVLEQFARILSRKFAHAPSQALKQAGQDGNATLISAARRLFKLSR
ncbi:MAG: glutamyl-tRNA reductase [Arenicellales bacterium]|jgi:glutamyl-tRNA reductase|nr:glutamyl-tRNA reductase [Arenicellales bacterium]MDP6313099.1 glutamyl-tRNA reductase [Arenicellales bacterium]MDP7120456.1 glutamyl-tRNA reductase [Arenicellales bacterium]MDP7193071.1 glutamyl-tRNA reductase [Arenicellales bacterium]MDP7489068.1 glutamyl-tRNA reductase [Arenicellales bacterium]|tara:strand:- start:2258 stop:3511 length:1254 start_codon:yes stop_codon:yes gene_type:complete